MRESESALFTLVSEEERKRLALGSQRTEFKAGDVLQKYGQVCFSVYVVIEGELEVCSVDKRGNPSRIGVLTRGHAFGEFCVVACAKGQTLVRASTDCMVVDVPMEVINAPNSHTLLFHRLNPKPSTRCDPRSKLSYITIPRLHPKP
jgi:CRP-like cAMP-binding protein